MFDGLEEACVSPPTLRADQILAGLDDENAAILERLLRNPHVTAFRLSNELRGRGVKLHRDAITNWRTENDVR